MAFAEIFSRKPTN